VIDFGCEDFVDAEYLDAHRSGSLNLGAFSGTHAGVVVAANGQIAWIDRKIAPLVYLLWHNGVQTTESCQDVYGNPGEPATSLLGFASTQDLELFLEIVAPEDGEPGGLWDRATGCNVDTTAAGMWEYGLFPHIEGRDVYLYCSACFPLSDAHVLQARLQARVT